MAVMLRTQLASTVLSSTALTTAQVAEGMQVGSNQQLAVYSILSCSDSSSSERIKFAFAGGLTQDYAQADYQYLINTDGAEYFYGSVCVLMNPGRKTGSGPDWRYAQSPTSDIVLPVAYTV
jgi:hypothetical protein